MMVKHCLLLAFLIATASAQVNGPGNPAVPTEPIQPIEPIEPTEPAEPAELTEAPEPTEPTEAPEPTEPVETIKPAIYKVANFKLNIDNLASANQHQMPRQQVNGPGNPAVPAVPTEPIEPIEPIEPAEPAEPTEAPEPTEPVEPIEPAIYKVANFKLNIDNLASANQHQMPRQQVNGPGNPAVPTEPIEPIEPIEPAEPAEPTEAPEPTEPVEPIEPAIYKVANFKLNIHNLAPANQHQMPRQQAEPAEPGEPAESEYESPEPPESEAPESEAPEAPESEAPESEAPESEAPESEAPEAPEPAILIDGRRRMVPKDILAFPKWNGVSQSDKTMIKQTSTGAAGKIIGILLGSLFLVAAIVASFVGLYVYRKGEPLMITEMGENLLTTTV